MQFIDLQRQQQKIATTLQQKMAAVLQHGKYIDGPEVAELETKIEILLNKETHAIACANGTDALQIACMALGLKTGNEVITTPLSFMATAEVPVLLGFKPVFVDVEPHTANLDPHKLEAAITPKTKLILAVSLYGQCANYTEINRIAAKYHIPVLEDGAESFAAKHHGCLSGALTDIATTSFFPAKPLGCYGDGGMVFAKNPELASNIRRICRHGQSARYQHSLVGVNSRLDTIQAAVLLAKLDVLQGEHQKKQEIAKYYYSAFKNKVGLLQVQPENESAHGYFPILVEQRDKMRQALEQAQIPYSLHFPCLHTQAAIANLGYLQGDFPIAERISSQVITIPMHAYLTDSEIEQIVSCVLQNS